MQKYSAISYTTLFFGTFFLDRISKAWAISKLQDPYQLSAYWSLDLVYNRGVSWSLLNFADNSLFLILSIAIALILLSVALYTAIRWMNHNIVIGELLVLAGGISNLIDRFFYAGVVDFIHFSANGWSFPIFNVADILIVSGVIIMIFSTYTDA